MVIFRYVPYKRLLSYVIMSIIGFTMLGVYVVVLTWCTTLGFPEYTGNRLPVYTREKPPDTHVERLVQNIQRHNRELQFSKSGDIDKKYFWTQADIRNFENSESTKTPVNSIYLDGKSNVNTDKTDNSDTMDNTDKNILQPSHQSGNITAIQYNNPRTFTKIRQKMSKKLPQALIIGVKKGGTRALLEFLRIHPDVRAPGPEPHFFDRNYDKGLEWYRHQMPSTLDGQLTMEKTPSYFVTKEVPQRIYNMSKNIKLIVVVRDPVTRAISDYTQAATKRPAMKPFEKMAFIDNTSRIVDTKWAAVKIGVYAKHLEKWLKYFPLRQIHFVNGEQLIANPAGEMAKVQDFLGLKQIVTDKHFYLNETRGFPCLKKPEGSGRPHCLGKTKGRQHPNVDPHVLQRLRDFFKPFNAKFYQLTGQSFNWN